MASKTRIALVNLAMLIFIILTVLLVIVGLAIFFLIAYPILTIMDNVRNGRRRCPRCHRNEAFNYRVDTDPQDETGSSWEIRTCQFCGYIEARITHDLAESPWRSVSPPSPAH